MPLKVTSGKTGKSYDMPWSLATDPSDDDVDRFIASQELQGSSSGPSSVKSAGSGITFRSEFGKKPLERQVAPSAKEIKENFFKNVIPKFDTNDISLATDSYPVRAGKELFNTFVSDASSPATVAAGAVVGKVAQAAKPYLGRMLPFLNKFGNSAESSVIGSGPSKVSAANAPRTALADAGLIAEGKSTNSSSVIPNNTQRTGMIPVDNGIPPVIDASGRPIAPPQNLPPSRPNGPWDNNPIPEGPKPVSAVDAIKSQQTPNGVRQLTQQGQKRFILPQDLRGSKPRFNMGNKIYIPQFENDLDKAAYVIAQKTPSKRDADFLKFFMDSTGMTDDAARLYGQQVRARIKANVVGQAEGDVRIPDMFSGFKSSAANAPLTKTEVTNAAIVKEGLATKPKVRVEGPGKVNLINPTQETVDKMMSKGYHPTGEINPDGSIKLIQKVNQVGLSKVNSIPVVNKPYGPGDYAMDNAYTKARGGTVSPEMERLAADPGSKSPSFPKGGSNGGIPPTNIPAAVNAAAPTPPKPKFGLVTQLGVNLKSATAGLDLSAPLRQGRALMHKKEYYKAIPDMFKSLKSEKGYQEVMDSISNHPNFDLAKESKLALMGLGDDLTQREEAIMGSMVEKIPGIGRLYRGSNRAYSGFLNKLRMDTFSSLLDDASKITGRKVNPAEIADLVNVMSGRGKLGQFEGSAPLLNSVFFSPRFISSRVKLLTSPVSYANADPFVRKEAIKSLAALVGSQAILIGLASKAGMKTSFNPTSSDFMKFRKGNNRIDTNGGVQQLFVLASRLASGKTTSSVTGKTNKMDTGKFGAPTSGQALWRFGTSKEAPLLGLISDLWTGQDFKGEKQGATESVVRRVAPMILQDMVDIAKDDPKNSWLLAPAAFGASVQTYGKKK